MAAKRKDGEPSNHTALKHKPWTDAIRMAVSREMKVKGGKTKVLQMLANRVVKKAMTGDMRAVEMVADRMEGKVPNTVNVRRITGLHDLDEDELAALAHGGGGKGEE